MRYFNGILYDEFLIDRFYVDKNKITSNVNIPHSDEINYLFRRVLDIMPTVKREGFFFYIHIIDYARKKMNHRHPMMMIHVVSSMERYNVNKNGLHRRKK